MKLLRIPVGVSDFEEIRRNGYYYVDKSGLIGEILGTTGTKVTLITRPRWFGKTLGMSGNTCTGIKNMMDQKQIQSDNMNIMQSY